MRILVGLSVLVLASLIASRAQAQFGFNKTESIAITEFMSRPIGEADGRQWVELFNYGKEAVDLKGFQLSDMGRELCDIPEVTIEPGNFVIVVMGYDRRRLGDDRKKIFEAEWLGGKEDPRVVGVDIRFHMSAAGALQLLNRRKATLWVLGYKADDKVGNSTYLAMDRFDVKHYGTREKPSINRRGDDGTVLGYEGQDFKKEEGAIMSDVSKLESIGGFVYQAKSAGGTNDPSVGSPLKGKYTKLP